MKFQNQIILAILGFGCAIAFYKTSLAYPEVSQSMLTITSNGKRLPSCSAREYYFLENFVNISLRIMIIASFSCVTLVGRSSLIERYLQCISRNYLVVGLSLLTLLSFSMMGFIILSSGANQNCTI